MLCEAAFEFKRKSVPGPKKDRTHTAIIHERMSMSAANLQIYNQPEVASHYAILNYLTPCEQLLFGLYIKPGAAILDIGVGGGRTTPYLSSLASRYLGIDYASEMIRVCRRKHPDLEFVEAEASDLSFLASASFDAVVIAFNGLDYVIPDEKRARCFKECHRVLKTGGVVLFSSHNPRSIFLRPAWNQERARMAAEAFAGADGLVSRLAFFLLSLGAGMRAFLRAAWGSVKRALARIPTRAFWHGEGYLRDSAHGGLITHCWVPDRAVAELQKQPFQFLKVLGDDYPRVSRKYITDWYYYVFSKSDPAGHGETCA
jgi:SAM-dependent methyltransferase